MSVDNTQVNRTKAEPIAPRLRARPVLAALWFVFAGAASAADFVAAVDKAEWRLQVSSVECRLSQPIPYFGVAEFVQRAGEEPRFALSSEHDGIAGNTRLLIAAPPWRAAIEPVEIGSARVRSGSTAIELGRALTEQMLAALFEGLSPVFDAVPSYAPGGHSSVALVAVNFRPAYLDFRSCLAGLPRLSQQDVTRTRISYGNANSGLDAAGRARLDAVARHVAESGGLKAIYVDGYTDDIGRASVNLELSKTRAQGVVDYLVARGVPAKLITMRYHGSRYPVAKGRSAAARAQNRRVTVRLDGL